MTTTTRIPTHPGALLCDVILPACGVPMTPVAKALRLSRQSLYQLINERRPVTPLVALRLGKAFGNAPLFWLNMQARHDLAVQGAEQAGLLAEIEMLKAA